MEFQSASAVPIEETGDAEPIRPGSSTAILGMGKCLAIGIWDLDSPASRLASATPPPTAVEVTFQTTRLPSRVFASFAVCNKAWYSSIGRTEPKRSSGSEPTFTLSSPRRPAFHTCETSNTTKHVSHAIDVGNRADAPRALADGAVRPLASK